MDEDINFCPFCDAAQHKIMNIKDDMLFCKECSRFFILELKKFKCPRCDSDNIINSDFPTPEGEMIFQCKKCKRMFPSKDFFAKQG